MVVKGSLVVKKEEEGGRFKITKSKIWALSACKWGFHWLIGLGAVLYKRLLYDYCLVEIKDGKKR